MLIVEEMKYENMLNMTAHLYNNNYYLGSEEGVKITFKNLKFIEPAGAVLFLSTMDKIHELQIPYEIEPIDKYRNKSAISYGETMGIFQQIGLSDAPSNSSGFTYLAPTKVEIKEVHKNLEGSLEQYFEQISELIVIKALKLVGTNLVENVNDLFMFVVREMIRNIFDHAQTSHYYYALQTYKANNCVEVVIADVGVGLLATIPFDIEEKWLEKNTDEEAIKKSLIPGLSAFSNHSYAPEDYKNSGYGLTLVKKIIQRTEGLFSIASGAKSITYTAEEEFVSDCDVTGTIVRMKINLNKLKYVNFKEVLREAETEARDKGFIQTPSTASKTVKSLREK